MSIRKLIDTEIQSQSGELFGNIASPFFEWAPDGSENYTFACDVDLRSNDTTGEGNVLRNVPITEVAKNDVLRWGIAGSSVALKLIAKDKYVIVGIAPKKISSTHIIQVDFSEYIGRIVSDEFVGRVYRALTFEELGLYGGGWGQCPWGAWGCWRADGTFIELIYR